MNLIPPFPDDEIIRLSHQMPGYVIQRWIASGGMGVVYLAKQVVLDRLVAIKFLSRELSASEEFRRSFENEAKAMAKLSHPNLIAVYDFGEVDGMLFLVMEYVEGKPLHFSIKAGGAVECRQAVEVLLPLADGLSAAHAKGVIHRDLKPGNVLMTPKRQPKLGDFGLAVLPGQGGEGLCMGTPGYMAPELEGNPMGADEKTDLYALGVIFHEMLSGRAPEDGGVDVGCLAGVDPRLIKICLKAVQPDRALRYESVDAFAKDLREWIGGEAKQAGPSASKRPVLVSAASPVPLRRGSGGMKSEGGGGMLDFRLLVRLGVIVGLLVAIGVAWARLQNKKQVIAESGKQRAPEVRELVKAEDGEGIGEGGREIPTEPLLLGSVKKVAEKKTEGAVKPEEFPDFKCEGCWVFSDQLLHTLTLRPDGTFIRLGGSKGRWYLAKKGEGYQLTIDWLNQWKDLFEVGSNPNDLSGENTEGKAVRILRLQDVPEVPLRRFTDSVWAESATSPTVWRFLENGKVKLETYADARREGSPKSEVEYPWVRGPLGNQVTVLWEGNPRWFNVASMSDDGKEMRVINQRKTSYPLIRVAGSAAGTESGGFFVKGSQWEGTWQTNQGAGVRVKAVVAEVSLKEMAIDVASGSQKWRCLFKADGQSWRVVDVVLGGKSRYPGLSLPVLVQAGEKKWSFEGTGMMVDRKSEFFKCEMYPEGEVSAPRVSGIPLVERDFPMMDRVVGVWRWHDNDHNFYLLVARNGMVYEQNRRRGKWQRVDMQKESYKIQWDRSYDLFELSPQGDRMEGRTQHGGVCKLVRVGQLPMRSLTENDLVADAQGYRFWTYREEGKGMEARYLRRSQSGRAVDLEMKNGGRILSVPLDRLTEGDRHFVRSLIPSGEVLDVELKAQGRPNWKVVEVDVRAGTMPIMVVVKGDPPEGDSRRIHGLPRPRYERMVPAGESLTFSFASGNNYQIEALGEGHFLLETETQREKNRLAQ